MRILATTIAAASLLLAGTAWAQDIKQLQNIGQTQFRALSEDLGAALSYRPQTPTTPLGITGFDIGAAVTLAKIKNTTVLQQVSADPAKEVKATLPVPSLRVYKGLPFGIDIGLLYASIPGSNMKYTGGELRYAILEGGTAVPAIGIRGSFTKLSGVDQLALDTKGLDVSISKGFANITPYAGVGRVWVTSDPKDVPTLSKEKIGMGKAFVGLGINFLLMNINIEADKTGETSGASFKLGFRF